MCNAELQVAVPHAEPYAACKMPKDAARISLAQPQATVHLSIPQGCGGSLQVVLQLAVVLLQLGVVLLGLVVHLLPGGHLPHPGLVAPASLNAAPRPAQVTLARVNILGGHREHPTRRCDQAFHFMPEIIACPVMPPNRTCTTTKAPF